MNESSKYSKKSSHRRVSHKGSLFSNTKRGGLGGLKKRISGRAKSAYDKGEKVYKKVKGLYDSVDDAGKEMITRVAKKGYDTYKKRRALSERIEKNRQSK